MEWYDETWNPVTGCSPISEGCETCPARRSARRLKGRFGYPDDDPFQIMPRPDRLEKPFRWKRPRKVLACSVGDIAHHDIPVDFFLRIWEVMRACPQHTFILLTKRPIGLSELIRLAEGGVRDDLADKILALPSNIWIGISAENQKRFDDRIPFLAQIPAAVRFLSVEPMLGPISLKKRACLGCGKEICDCPIESGLTFRANRPGIDSPYWPLDRVICSVDTDPEAKLESSRWVADLKSQCADAGISLHPSS